MSSGRQTKERCRFCGSSELKAISPDQDSTLLGKLWYSRRHCKRCGVVFSVPHISLGLKEEIIRN